MRYRRQKRRTFGRSRRRRGRTGRTRRVRPMRVGYRF